MNEVERRHVPAEGGSVHPTERIEGSIWHRSCHGLAVEPRSEEWISQSYSVVAKHKCLWCFRNRGLVRTAAPALQYGQAV